MSALDNLIEAVEAGEISLLGPRSFYAVNSGEGVYVDRRASDALRAYNGSLDAALALHEALLPGWGCQVNNAANGGRCSVYIFPGKMPQTGNKQASAETPARAWLLAILRAYRSVQQ